MKRIFFIASLFLGIPCVALAHEAYVLPQDFFWKELANPASWKAFDALQNHHNVILTLEIVLGVVALFLLNFLFRQTNIGRRFHKHLERAAFVGPLFVRVAVAVAFFLSAQSGVFLGPELPISALPLAELMRLGLYLSSIMIFFGIFTEVAALIGLVVFTAAFVTFGTYLGTYLNYLGELIALALFGMRRLSIDRVLFGALAKWREKFEPYETTIVRVFYGLALIYAGVTVKFLHPELTLHVIEEWNLLQFHWLFPGDPLLVVLGGGLAEVAIGLLLIIGFEVRLTVLISLIYITLSLFYFRELVWPHIILYGVSFSLLVQPEILTLDHFLSKKHLFEMPIWKRLFTSHRTQEESMAVLPAATEK